MNDYLLARLIKEDKMNYKKPEVVARSAVRHSYVAGCPANKPTHTWKTVRGQRIDFGCERCEMSGS